MTNEVREAIADLWGYVESFEAEIDEVRHDCGNWDMGNQYDCPRCNAIRSHRRMLEIATALTKFADSQPQAPTPSWDDAPEWAEWWTVGPDGFERWHEHEPQVTHRPINVWDWHQQGRSKGDRKVWDWRTLKCKRPESQP